LICVKAIPDRALALFGPTAEGATIMSAFTVGALASGQILSVYPLIREAMPEVTLATWTEFARRVTGRRSHNAGIMAAWREGRSFPCGLFCYRVDKTLGQGRVLIAEYFVAVDLLDPKGVLAALVAELDALGRRLGCNAVRSVVHGGEQEVAGGLAAAGHTPEASLLLKALVARASARRRHGAGTQAR
jgi:hypothetical protein